MVDEPKAESEKGKTQDEKSEPSYSEAVAREQQEGPTENQTGKSDKSRDYSQYVMRSFQAMRFAWRYVCAFFKWQYVRDFLKLLDRHNGAINALATVAIVVLTWFYVRYSKAQWETMNRQLELAERPWMSADVSIISPLEFDENGANITLRFQFKNGGHSPAVRTQFGVEFFSIVGNPQAEREKLCQQVGGQSALASNAPLLDTFFPGDQLPQDIQISLTRQGMQTTAKEMGGFIYPEIIACIAYRPTFADAQYHTGLIFDLLRYDPAHPYISLGIDTTKGNVPITSLVLRRLLFGGVYAD